MTQVIPCPPSPTLNLHDEMTLMGFQNISNYSIPSPSQLVMKSTPITGTASPSKASVSIIPKQSIPQRRARTKSISSPRQAPRKRSFSRSVSKSTNSKKPRTGSRYFNTTLEAPSTPTRFDFSFVGTNKPIPFDRSMGAKFRSRSPIRRKPSVVDPLTPYKNGQVSWPLRPRFPSRSRSCANSDMSGDEADGSDVSKDKLAACKSSERKRERKRLIDKLNGASFVLDPAPSDNERKSKYRNKKREPKRIIHKSKPMNKPNYQPRPMRVWVTKYEEIAKRDAEAEARILAMGSR